MAELYGGNILFVDDDTAVLQDLHGMLRPICSEWSMAFVESGAAALRALTKTVYEVVVADFRMPEMNGAELLAEVRKHYPKTVRLMLLESGDKELIVKHSGIAHQVLMKPCDAEAVRTAIRRAVAFESSVRSDEIKKVVTQFDRIPSVPDVYKEIVAKLDDENATPEQIAIIIGKDMALTAKLIKLVNSAFFGLKQQVSSLAEAAAFLGMDTIKNLVLSVNTFASFEGCKFPGFTLEGLWTHSLEVGHLARQIIELEYLPRSFGQESLIAGLLHDIGKLVLAVNMPAGYQAALQLAEKESLPMHRAEEITLGVNHAEVGGYILSLWGLPGRVVDAVAYHHEPERLGATFLNPAVAVFLANAAVHRMTSGEAVRVDESRLQFLTSLDIGEALLCWIYANV